MYRLHCFAQSGNCFKVAFLLRALEQPFETVYVDFLHGATRKDDWREQVNEMGEVPVLEDDDRRLTQSGAILTHVAAKHGAFGGADEVERSDVLRWLLYDNHKTTSYFATYRFLRSFGPAAPEPVLMKWLAGRIDAAYAVVDKHLAAQPYLVGPAPTIADFSMSAYLFYPAEESGLDVPGRVSNVGAWLERLRAIPGWAPPYDVLPGQRIAPKWA
jgi:glutathione S-transferase